MAQDDHPSMAAALARLQACMSEPEPARHQVQPGEYNHLLERYKAVAQQEGIDNPPPLIVLESPLVGPAGANGTLNAVSVRSRLLQLLDEAQLDGLLAHELRHVNQERKGMRFTSADESEIDADRAAVQATGNKEAQIAVLILVASEQTREMLEKTRQCIGEPSKETIESATQRMNAYLNKRTEAIAAYPASPKFPRER